MRFYLAGKIGKNGWRDTIRYPPVWEGSDGYEAAVNECQMAEPTEPLRWPVSLKSIFGEHDYVGPYFVRCDHGCFHGKTAHGSGLDQGGCQRSPHTMFGTTYIKHARARVHASCLEAIRRADAVFAYLDSLDAYGTLIELGYASALNIPIWLHLTTQTYADSLRTIDPSMGVGESELWFAIKTADKFWCTDEPPADVFRRFLSDDLAMMSYPDYLKTEHWITTRTAAIERAGHRCQICNAHENLEVHHRTYENRGAEDPTDLTVLCHDCHERFHEVRAGHATRMPNGKKRIRIGLRNTNS